MSAKSWADSWDTYNRARPVDRSTTRKSGRQREKEIGREVPIDARLRLSRKFVCTYFDVYASYGSKVRSRDDDDPFYHFYKFGQRSRIASPRFWTVFHRNRIQALHQPGTGIANTKIGAGFLSRDV